MKDVDTWPQLSGTICKDLTSVMEFKLRDERNWRLRMQTLGLSSVAQSK